MNYRNIFPFVRERLGNLCRGLRLDDELARMPSSLAEHHCCVLNQVRQDSLRMEIMKSKAFLVSCLALWANSGLQQSTIYAAPPVLDSRAPFGQVDLNKPLTFSDATIDTHVAPASFGCEQACDCTTGCDTVCGGSCQDNASWNDCGWKSWSFGSADNSHCGCSSGMLGLGLLPSTTGLIKRSDHCFDDFISPMTNPVYFEDPRALTELRSIFINHKLPVLLGNPGGSLQLYALQARARLTERLSLIAVKDGYIDSDSPLIQNGWADIGAGLKYTLYRDACNGRILAGGARFETTTGRRATLQGNGDGVFDFFLSGASRMGSASHYMTSAGFILPVDSQAENQMFYWSHHFDRRLTKKLYAFTEINWYNYMKSGSAFGAAIEGGDLFNFGSPGVAGNNIVTNAWGARYVANRHLNTGVAWEFPLTERRGVLDNRLTLDMIFRY
jgi:hypothetical protein